MASSQTDSFGCICAGFETSFTISLSGSMASLGLVDHSYILVLPCKDECVHTVIYMSGSPLQKHCSFQPETVIMSQRTKKKKQSTGSESFWELEIHFIILQ